MSHRFLRPLVIAWAALAFAPPVLAAGPPAASDPSAPVAALYATEKAGRPALAEPAERAATLSRGLDALWEKAEALADKSGDATIDFDVVTNSQGAEVKSVALTTERRDATHADVVATIDPGDWLRRSPRENVVRFALVREGGRWRIDDVSGVAEPNRWSLREMLRRALRAP